LHIFSEKLGLVGRADVVEVLQEGSLFPVEYKLGKYRSRVHDDLQLAAQAMCLEEMTGKSVSAGAIYHVASNRRRDVAIDSELRERVHAAIREIRLIQAMPALPPPVHDSRCKQCSLIDLCQPNLLNKLNQIQDKAYQGLFEASESSL
jgi:CRISPR-associated exonuclease Cas4